MDPNQLFKYVYAKYGLKFEPVLPGSTDVYVLMSPIDGSYFAMLSRFKERRIDILDLKCGDFASMIRDLPGFEDPVRVKDDGWVGAILDRQNETAIKKAFDYAFKLAMNGETNNIAQDQYLYIPPDDSEPEYKSQPIKLRNNNFKKKPLATDRIHRMQELYDYSVLPSVGRYKNFYNQGKFMADYEDDYSDYAAFRRFYPTYHDMKIEQLRSYFAWRTQLRKGNYQKVSTSYAYVYIYELLNNIGVKSAQDGYQKLIDFKENYVEKFDLSIEPYLNDWLKDYVLFYELDQKLIEENFEDEIAQDHDYIVLHDPESFSAKELAEVFARKTSYWNTSKTIKNNSEVFAKVLRCVWQELLLSKKYGIAYYSAFIAKPETVKRKVFLASIFYSKPKKLPVQLIDSLRKYRYNNGYWQIRKYTEAKKQKIHLNTFLHELDRVVRAKLHLGRPIKPRFIDQAVLKAIDQGIINYQTQEKKSRIDRIQINLSDLETIRNNASKTRDSLLTDEEKALEKEEQKQEESKIESKVEITDNDYDLNKDEIFLLLALLQDQPWQEYIKVHHLMDSILVDSINEKLFDEFGDSVIEFDEKDQPRIIEDYQTDLEEMFLKG